jgi:flagellar basal-body rod protein FlgF
MTRGIYAGATGMYAQQQALDVIANNLANADTIGFKSDRLTFREALDRSVYSPGEDHPRLVGRLGGGAVVEGAAFTPDQGPALATGGRMDVLLDEDAFLSVQSPQGVRYTKNGSLQLDASRKLVTRDGLPVLGEKGEITIPSGATPEIDPSGNVRADGTVIDRLAIVSGQLTKEGNGLYSGEAQPVANPTLMVGHLEGSNVNAIREVVAMIEVMRVFEANQKVVQAHDDALRRAISDLAQIE